MMDLKKKVADLCTGNYSILAKYFQDITLKDLADLSEEEIIDSVDPQSKLTMRLFIKRVLREYFTEIEDIYSKPQQEPKVKGNVLNLRGKVVSNLFPDIHTDKISIANTKEILENVDKTKIEILDLSSSTLFDRDLPFILDLVRYLPQVKVVNLSLNRIYGVDASQKINVEVENQLKELLSKCVVVIYGNAIASVDGKYFFGSLKETEIKNLIWIPKTWVSAGSWKALIAKEYHDLVIEVHEKYFKEEPSK